MKTTGKTHRQFVSILIALVCLMGPPASIICSPLAGNDVDTAYQASRLAAGSGVIEGLASRLDPASRARGNDLYAGRPVTFEANHGQTDARVKFLSRGDQQTLFLMPTEAMITFGRSRVTGDTGPQANTPAPIPDAQAAALATPLRMTLAGANASAKMTGEEELACKTSYLIGSDSRRWRTNLSSYGRVRSRNVYRGIDMVYHANQQQLEYDFIVAPRANPRAITLDFHGAQRLHLDANGDLVLGTPGGEVRHKRPSVYQEGNGIRKEVAGRYEIKGRSRVAFNIAAYDRSKPLVIDPEIIYSTYFGGTKAPVVPPWGMQKADQITDVAIDKFGNAYVTGDATSLDLPTTPGAFQSVNHTVGQHDFRSSDAFVAKFDAAGKLVYSTYFGGVGFDCGLNIAIDAAGSAYVKGITNSADMPVTGGALQPRCQTCTFFYDWGNRYLESMDNFVFKLDPAGASLVYSTFLGFFSTQEGGFAVDGNGNAVLAGGIWTDSLRIVNGLQTTNRSFDFEQANGIDAGRTADAYVAKLNATGSAWLYSTYLGGKWSDFVKGLALDAEGKIYVTGETQSQDFPTKNGYQNEPTMPFPDMSIFLTKIDPDKSGAESLLYSTFIGDRSYCKGLTVDQQGGVYIMGGVVGDTNRGSFPRTLSLQPSRRFAGPMLIKIDTRYSGDLSFAYALLYASSDAENYTTALDAAVDRAGNIYLAGYTQDPDFTEVNSLQKIGPFVASADSGQHFVSHRIATPHSLQLTTQVRFITPDPKDPATVYAGNSESSHLLYKSTDSGVSWSEIDFGWITNMPSVVVINPKDTSVVYAGMRYSLSLVFKSTDAGSSWTALNTPHQSAYTDVSALVMDPQDPLTLYAGCADRTGKSPGVIKSTDGGLTWAEKNLGLTEPDVTSLVIDPKTPATLWAGTKSGLFKSTDGGNSWSDSPIKKFVVNLAVDPQTPATAYASLAETDIRIASFDGRGNPRRRITIDSLTTLEGVVKSTDGGASWRSVNNGFGAFVPLGYAFAIDPRNPSTVYAATAEGFFKSTDGGAHWNFTGSVYNQTRAVALAAPAGSAPPMLYAGTYVTPKAFMMKFNPEGTRILFSSGLGGNHFSDFGFGIAVDDAENAYVVGQTNSSNFPTKNAFQTAEINGGAPYISGFLMKIDTRDKPAPPVVRITDVSLSGKRLLVYGENFSAGAVIMLDDAEQPTVNDSENPTTVLLSKKAGKKMKSMAGVTLQVKNADGTMSEVFQYVRPAN